MSLLVALSLKSPTRGVSIKYCIVLYIDFDRNIKTTVTVQTCWPLLPPPTSPVFRGEVVDAAPLLIPGVVAVGVVVALLSGGKNPVADIGTTSKNCFWDKREKMKVSTSFLIITCSKSENYY